jgi:cytochrome c oxidase subunit II
MPSPVRRKTLVLVLALGAALALAAVGYADDNAGFTPVEPESPNADRILDSYLWISIFAIAILALVEGALVMFIVKYRRRGRPRTVEGPQIHGATRLELIWTAVPVLILAAIAAFIFYKLPGIEDVPSARAQGGPLEIRIDAHQFYWQFTYPDGGVSINDLHVPVNRVVRVEIHSQDVDHSWWVPALGGKFDAIPGDPTETWFEAERVGTYRGQCGEFCGVYHAAMRARVIAHSQGDYDAWVRQEGPRSLGQSEWTGVCAQCHGLRGEGGYGPAIANSSLLIQPESLRALLRQGRNTSGDIDAYMPPVGLGWSARQFRALEEYLDRQIYKGARSGG